MILFFLLRLKTKINILFIRFWGVLEAYCHEKSVTIEDDFDKVYLFLKIPAYFTFLNFPFRSFFVLFLWNGCVVKRDRRRHSRINVDLLLQRKGQKKEISKRNTIGLKILESIFISQFDYVSELRDLFLRM